MVRGGDVLAALEIADAWRDRQRGLLGRDHLDGALLLNRTRQVHSFRMRFDIDVAYCDADLVVKKVVRLRRNRLGPLVWSARSVIEAECGSFERWNLAVGDQLEVRTVGGQT